MTDAATDGNARAVACELLQAVLRRGRTLDAALADHAGLLRLEPRDRAFARQLVATTLRRLGEIDGVLAACLEQPLAPRAHVVRDLMRLGVCQLVFLGTPPHAAVDSTVSLVGRLGGAAGLKGLANAVLRRIARDGKTLVATCDTTANTPVWLRESWIAAYGVAAADAIAAAHLAEPPFDITLKDDSGSGIDWAVRLGARLLPTGSLRRTTADGGAIEQLPGFAEGAWWVQDAASALPARLFGPVGGRTVVDLCAAPGGKTAQLAAAGANVIAVDRSAQRLRRLTENLTRLRLSAMVVSADATLWRPSQAADAVLLDAPCSATGTIRRHPDVPWLKSPGDVARLTGLQDRLLAAAVEMAAPGGTIVYCACSLQPDEGPMRISALLAAGAPVARRPINSDEVGGLPELLSADGDLRTLPCHMADQGGLDGFYAARLTRL